MNSNRIHGKRLKLFEILFFLLTPNLIFAAKSVHFNFPSFNPRSITLLGDSYLKNGVVGLTRDSTVPATSSGTAIYNLPIQFFDPDSNSTASFSTNFSFSISNLNPSSSGDGLTFFISPNNLTLGSPGGFLGLANSSQSTKSRFIAIEFDTKLDVNFNDPNDNHVGLDVDSLFSIKTANLVAFGVDLKSGFPIYAWIDYENDQKKLKVYVGRDESRPKSPVLEANIDLSYHFKELMYLGFSGSTEGSTELHMIQSWSFQTFGFSPLKPKNRDHDRLPNDSVNVPPEVPSSCTSDHRKIRLGLGIGLPALFCCLLVIFGWVSVKKWKGVKKQKSFKAQIMAGQREFSYKELKLATKGFHSSRILGHGAFGTVYKAFFASSGAISAMKRSKHSHEGKTEFLAELSIIACLRHKNLVQLQGWCIEKDELLLVYDFMPNGSLDKALYPEPDSTNNNPSPVLPWASRYNIALGLASVLSYLHQECEQQVIHRDIKTSNIMLDSSFNARLGDFGLARLTEHDKSPVSTLTAGTMGYLAPEYLQFGRASEKTDVFSYGVVVLELACGRRPIEKVEKMVNLVDCVWGLYGEGRIIEAADERLNNEFVKEEIERLLVVGLSCVNPDCEARPSMRRVLQMLNKETELWDVPRVKPTLVFSCSVPVSIEEIVSEDEKDQCGVDDNGKRSTQDLSEIKVDNWNGVSR